MRPGDVFFHNDVYLSEGGIGHLPDLCVTVPVFHAAATVVAFVQAFGHHDDIGGAVPGSMPSHATQRVRGGADGAADPAVGPGRAQRGRAEDHDPQLAHARLARGRPRRRVLGLPDGRAADSASCSTGTAGRPSRRASTPSSTTPRRRSGARSWRRSPTAPTSGRTTPSTTASTRPRLHAQRITLTKTAGEAGRSTSPAPPRRRRGPINHCGDYADGVFLAKWLAPILRNLADTPERMAELDVNEGVVPLIEMRFPPKGTLLTPVFPAPTNARTFVILRLLGVLAGRAGQGRGRPDAGRPGDDPLHRRVRRRRRRRAVPDARGARRRLGRALLRRRRGHHPRRPRLAQHPGRVRRGALAVRGRAARAWPSTPAGPGGTAAGCGYDKHIRMLRDAHFMSIADRSILACWGVRGGRAGRPFQVTIDPGGPERAGRRRAGRRRAGARGRGDPDPHHRRRWLGRPARPPVCRGAPRRGLGQGLGRRRRGPTTAYASSTARWTRRPRTPNGPGGAPRGPAVEPFFDRGPGYAPLSGGQAHADVDILVP